MCVCVCVCVYVYIYTHMYDTVRQSIFLSVLASGAVSHDQ